MHLTFAYLVAAGVGVLIAHYISRAPELRSMRLSQLVLVPCALVVGLYFANGGGMAGFVAFLVVLLFLVILLAPNIGYLIGAGFSNFLDPQDWTSAEEEIALLPIRRLIDKENYRQALGELDELLKTHKPTYEAVLLKAQLLHHIGRVDETVTTLLSLIALSNSTAQQLAVMENLAFLEEDQQAPPNPPAAGARRVQISHELVLFPTNEATSASHKEIPPGVYDVVGIVHRNRHWLKLAAENWGNAERCWEAIRAVDQPAGEPPKNGFFRRIARMHQAISRSMRGKPRRELMADSQKLFREASEFIRREEWAKALPLLQQASACDPDRYEIAYRWALAVRHTSDDAATAEVVGRVLRQSIWTDNERQMLEELKRPLAK